jgi:chromosome segregation ATPase
MSQETALGRLRKDLQKVEEDLRQMEVQKKDLDDKYLAAKQEEDKVVAELRSCRDAYKYNQLEMRLSILSRRRKEAEAVKEENERKMRGYREEIVKIKAKIEYLKPKDNKFITEKP